MWVEYYSHLTAYEDGTECSETSAYKLLTPGNFPKESTQHTEHGESLKSRLNIVFYKAVTETFLEPISPHCVD